MAFLFNVILGGFTQKIHAVAHRLFAKLWANDDHGQYKAAQQLLSGRYAWFEQEVLDPAGDGPMMPTQPKPAAKQFVEESAAVAPKAETTAAQ